MQHSFSKQQLLDAYNPILLAVRSGKFVYPEWKLNVGHRSYKLLYFQYAIGGLCTLFFGAIAAVGVPEAGGLFLLFLALTVMTHVNATNYEDLAYQFLMRPMPKAPAAQSLSAADELSKLSALRKEGVLSDEEFIALKKKIL